jgi:hypothetical protein
MATRLFSAGSVKIDKSNAFSTEYHSKILYLSPYKVSGYQTCAHASPGCAAACLNTAGMGVYTNVQEARIRKTKFFFENRTDFLRQISWEIHCAQKLAAKKGQKLVIRLNGTSDLPWEKLSSLIQDFPGVQFYDYTKDYRKMKEFLAGKLPPNYHLTFSLSEINLEKALDIFRLGGNVAVVYNSKAKKKDRKFPSHWNGHEVIDGDQHDLRFLDRKNVIVGLWAKGKARKDTSQFAIMV